WLAGLVVVGLREHLSVVACVAPVGLYVADVTTTIVRRARLGEPLHQPHRRHAYQLLVQLGWSHAAVDGVVGTAVVLCAVLGHLALRVGPAAQAGLAVAAAAVVAAYLALPLE